MEVHGRPHSDRAPAGGYRLDRAPSEARAADLGFAVHLRGLGIVMESPTEKLFRGIFKNVSSVVVSGFVDARAA